MHNFELNYNQKPEILLSDCDISSRALNHLRSVRIDKLNDLVNFTEEELKEKMPMANSKTFQEIKELLTEHNLSFKS